MHYTYIDPFSGNYVHIARHLGDGKLQRALLPFFKPENYFMVQEALIPAGRQDLIGSGCDCLIPAQPPKGAIEARRQRANQAARGKEVEGDHYHTVANPTRDEKPGDPHTISPFPGLFLAGRSDDRSYATEGVF